jgi:hypothetical protein
MNRRGDLSRPAHRIRVDAVRVLASRRLGLNLQLTEVERLIATHGRADVALRQLAASLTPRDVQPTPRPKHLVERGVTPAEAPPTKDHQLTTRSEGKPSPRARRPSRATVSDSRHRSQRLAGVGLATLVVALGAALAILFPAPPASEASVAAGSLLGILRVIGRWRNHPALSKPFTGWQVARTLNFVGVAAAGIPTLRLANAVGGFGPIVAGAIYASWFAEELFFILR